MDEVVFYNSVGDASDKQYSTSFAFLSSVHSSNQYSQFRQCYSGTNAAVMTGLGLGEKLIVACKGKALIHVYLYGKESPEQKIPIPEELTCLEICQHPNLNKEWLLIGGSKSGRIYVWELSSGYLLTVKESHYQSVSVLKYSKGFLVSGGLDSRVVVWKIIDLISSVHTDSISDSKKILKPYAIFTDHTLPVTGLIINQGLINDLKVFSCSKDSTIRCYDLCSKDLLTTLVTPFAVDSIAADPAFRSLYAGLSNGSIRVISLFQAAPKTKVLEQVGGYGKIVTLKTDNELLETFIHHQQGAQQGEEINVTQLEVSFDGTTIVSGDSKGRLFVADIVTKQTSKKLKSLVGSVSVVKLFQVETNSPSLSKNNNDKTVVRSIPVLKRTLMEPSDLVKHEIIMKLKEVLNDGTPTEFELSSFLNAVKSEEKWFTNFTGIESSVFKSGSNSGVASTVSNNICEERKKIKELEAQLQNVSGAYEDLKLNHESLFKEHSKLLNERK